LNELFGALQLLMVIGLSLLPLIGVVVFFVAGYKRLTGRPTRLGPVADGVVRAMNASVFQPSLRAIQYEPIPETSQDWAGDDLESQVDAPATPVRRRMRRSDRLRRARV
jgi:hypothetical protein